VPYFHVVFALPAAIADIAYQNKTVVYDLLFKASAETLTTIAADPKHLGARVGITSVLHSWGSAMTHHPHVHIDRAGRRHLARRRELGGVAAPASSCRARRAGSAAGAGMFAFPWSIGMVFTNPAAILTERAFMPHLRHPLCRNRAPQADSVIPAAPPTLLHTLLLDSLLPLEQEAPVNIAIQVPSPGCRRQALGSGLIGAVAGIAELPTHDAPRVII